MFLHNIAVQKRALATGVYDFDLAVNPLSVVLLSLLPTNSTANLAQFASYRAIAQAINRVSILYRGEAIVSMRGDDLAALNYYRWGIMPIQANHHDTNGEQRAVVLPIILGRFPYDGQSCFPATRRGELVLEVDVNNAGTGYTGLTFSAETIELLDAKPLEYEKKVQVQQTNLATGDQDVDLVCTGNMIRGILLFGTTPYTGAVPVPSFNRVKVLLDNQEAGYCNTNWEVAQTITSLWGRQPPAYDGHIHRFTDAAAGANTPTTSGPASMALGVAGAQAGADSWSQYAFLDYDPTGDDAHSLRTSGKSRLILRANVGTADLVRAIPVEVIKL